MSIEKVRRLIRTPVLETTAYAVPDAGDLAKMDAMENPYSWPEELRGAWLEALAGVQLNRYPDAGARLLKRRLRGAFSIPADLSLLLGNGSDEIIQIIALALARSGAVALAPEPGFAMYRLAAMTAGMDYVGVPLRSADFSLDAAAMEAAIGRHRPALIFLASPNNPTGNLFDAPAVERVIRRAPGLVVIDEAYFPYAQSTLLNLAERHEHVLIMRTLSKLGLAGLRLGFLIGRPCWLDELEKIRLPYNVGTLAQESARFFLDHVDVLDGQVRRIRLERGKLFDGLAAVAGVTAWPSAANFILFRVQGTPAAAVHGELQRGGILIKNLDGAHPLLRGCLRVTVGTESENAMFLEALRRILNPGS